jgi:hypothetical protein
LIVSFGGIAGLFIGCNLWNIFQMLYFITKFSVKNFYRKLYALDIVKAFVNDDVGSE